MKWPISWKDVKEKLDKLESGVVLPVVINLTDYGFTIDTLLAGGQAWPDDMVEKLTKAALENLEIVISGSSNVGGVNVPMQFKLSSIAQNSSQGMAIWMGLCGTMEPCVFLLTYSPSQKMGMCMMDSFVMKSTQSA